MSFYFRFQRYIFPSNLSKKLLFFRIDTILFHLLVERRTADPQQFGGQCLVVFRGLQRLDNPCPLLLLNLQRITFHATRRGQIQVGLVDCSGHRKQGCTTNRVTQFPHVARPAVVLQPFDGGRSKSGYSSVVLFTELCEEKLCQRQNVVRTLPKGR